MDWLDYREKLGIGFKDEQKFQYFITKIFNKLRSYRCYDDWSKLSSTEYCRFCSLVGAAIDVSLVDIDYNNNRFDHVLNILNKHCSYIEEFLAYYVAYLNIMDKPREAKLSQEDFKAILLNNLKEAHIPYELQQHNNELYVFPQGVSDFDDALVSQPLEWLKKYPKAEKGWSKALREYAAKEIEKASDVADLFRKALEAFFQEFFAGSKTLENYKADYGAYLKAQGVPSTIANNFETLLQAYTNFMNDCAKHHDATSDNVLEYLMYQTGNIMRLLITLKQGEQQNAD